MDRTIRSAARPRSDGTDTQFNYDAAGDLTSVTDVLGQTYNLTYNAQGQPLSISDPLGHITIDAVQSRADN